MTTTAPTDERIRAFVGEVAAHFDDLPADERDELLDDLRQHLTELAEDDEVGLDRELGDPAGYATDLRESAGLPPPGGRRGPAGRLADAAARHAESLRRRPAASALLGFLPELRPAWWVVRAWVVVAVVGMFLDGGSWWQHAVVPGRNLLGLVVAVGAVVLSVREGRAGRDGTAPWRVVDGVAAIALVGTLVAGVSGATADLSYAGQGDEVEAAYAEGEMSTVWGGTGLAPGVLRHPDGEPITNLYLYDAEGAPLQDVYVYDGVGRPVEVGDPATAGFWEIQTVYPRDRSGGVVTNRYPLEQYLVEEDVPGGTVRDPRPRPQVQVPTLPAARPAGPPAAPSSEGTNRPVSPSAAPSPTAGTSSPAEPSPDSPSQSSPSPRATPSDGS